MNRLRLALDKAEAEVIVLSQEKKVVEGSLTREKMTSAQLQEHLDIKSSALEKHQSESKEIKKALSTAKVSIKGEKASENSLKLKIQANEKLMLDSEKVHNEEKAVLTEQNAVLTHELREISLELDAFKESFNEKEGEVAALQVCTSLTLKTLKPFVSIYC